MDVTFIKDTRPSSNRSRRVAVWELPDSCRTFAISSLEEPSCLLSLLPFNPNRIAGMGDGFKKSYGLWYLHLSGRSRPKFSLLLDQANRPDFCSAGLTCYSPQ